MRVFIYACLMFLSSWSAGLAANDTKNQAKPVYRQNISYAMPESLEDLVLASEVVLRGTITAAAVKAIPHEYGDIPDVYTELTIRPEQILKVPRSDRRWSGATLQALQQAGVLESEDRITRVENPPPFAVGDDVFLFLRWNQRLNSYLVHAGPHGGFFVQNDRIKPIVRSPFSRDLEGQTAREFSRGLDYLLARHIKE